MLPNKVHYGMERGIFSDGGVIVKNIKYACSIVIRGEKAQT